MRDRICWEMPPSAHLLGAFEIFSHFIGRDAFSGILDRSFRLFVRVRMLEAQSSGFEAFSYVRTTLSMETETSHSIYLQNKILNQERTDAVTKILVGKKRTLKQRRSFDNLHIQKY